MKSRENYYKYKGKNNDYWRIIVMVIIILPVFIRRNRINISYNIIIITYFLLLSRNNNQKDDNKIAAIIACLKKLDHCERNQSKPCIQEAGEFYTTNITNRSIYDTKWNIRTFKLIGNFDHTCADHYLFLCQ